MGASLVDIHDSLEKRRTYGFFDDFDNYATGGRFTSTLNGSATIAAGTTAQFGTLIMSAVDSSANRELYVATTNSPFLFSLGVKDGGTAPLGIGNVLLAEAYIQYTEAATNEAMVMFGFMNAVGNGSIVNTTGEPPTSGSFAVIYKVPGTTVWKTCSSVGTGQTKTVSTTTAGGSNYQRLRIEAKPLTASIAEVSYFVDGVQLLNSASTRGPQRIKDTLTFTSAVAMQMFIGLKNGSSSPELLNCDYVAVEHLRGLSN